MKSIYLVFCLPLLLFSCTKEAPKPVEKPVSPYYIQAVINGQEMVLKDGENATFSRTGGSTAGNFSGEIYHRRDGGKLIGTDYEVGIRLHTNTPEDMRADDAAYLLPTDPYFAGKRIDDPDSYYREGVEVFLIEKSTGKEYSSAFRPQPYSSYLITNHLQKVVRTTIASTYYEPSYQSYYFVWTGELECILTSASGEEIKVTQCQLKLPVWGSDY